MKRILQLLTLSIFLFTLSCEKEEELIDLNAEKQLPKVDVCHYDEYTDTWTTISISQNALKAHLAHGDFEGSCEETKTYVPDNNFEYFLIEYGYDDVFDDYVLTKNIVSVEELTLSGDLVGPSGYIFDLTGIEDFKMLRDLRLSKQHTIPVIDLSSNLELRYLYLYRMDGINNPINLNISKNSLLEKLSIIQVPALKSLELSHMKNLKEVFLDYTGLVSLDLSKNVQLESVLLDRIYSLEYINLRNGNNPLISNFYINNDNANNSYCVEVDDIEWSVSNWTNINPWGTFSENCGF